MVALVAGGERSSVSVNEAEDILNRFRLENETGEVVESVDLSCRQWNQDALDVIEPFLKSIAETVHTVKFDDIIAGLMTDEGLSVTEKLADVFLTSKLTFVDLSDNAMGPRGLGRVGSLFASSHVESLFLNNCGLGEASMTQLTEYLTADDGRIARSLRWLELDRNMIGVGGAKEVGKFLPMCTNLEHFSYNGCRPSKEGTAYICQGLYDLSLALPEVALTYISLEDCSFGDGSDDEDGIITFTKGLKHCVNLKYLNMRDGAIEADGMDLLIDALTASSAKLTHLMLGESQHSSECLYATEFVVCTQHPCLTHIFSRNLYVFRWL
jgi:Ran GTPase-activating protein (RanGAP) involved in mRNA processing and transport